MIDSNLAVLLGWMGCHNKDPGVSGTSSGSVLGVGVGVWVGVWGCLGV